MTVPRTRIHLVRKPVRFTKLCVSTLWEWRKLAWAGIMVFTVVSLLILFLYTTKSYFPRISRARETESPEHLKAVIKLLCLEESTQSGEGHLEYAPSRGFSELIDTLRDHVKGCLKKFKEHSSLESPYNIPLLTLFTTWDYHENELGLHENTIKNWLTLRPEVQVVVYSSNPKVRSVCEKLGCNHSIPANLSHYNVPILKYMYLQTKQRFSSPFYAYANADILFEEGIIRTMKAVLRTFNVSRETVMIVGRRTNVVNVSRTEAVSYKLLSTVVRDRGNLFQTDAEDYFITTRNYPWAIVPNFIVGSPAYDNWLVAFSLVAKHVTVDATGSILAVHQTTNKGNYEGHHKKFTSYNKNLLTSLKSRVSTDAGHTICTEYITRVDLCGFTEIRNRTNKMCKRKIKK